MTWTSCRRSEAGKLWSRRRTSGASSLMGDAECYKEPAKEAGGGCCAPQMGWSRPVRQSSTGFSKPPTTQPSYLRLGMPCGERMAAAYSRPGAPCMSLVTRNWSSTSCVSEPQRRGVILHLWYRLYKRCGSHSAHAMSTCLTQLTLLQTSLPTPRSYGSGTSPWRNLAWLTSWPEGCRLHGIRGR